LQPRKLKLGNSVLEICLSQSKDSSFPFREASASPSWFPIWRLRTSRIAQKLRAIEQTERSKLTLAIDGLCSSINYCPLFQMESSNQIPPIVANMYPRNPNAGKPSNSGPPVTVIMMEEPIMSAAVTIPMVNRLMALSIV